MELTPSHAASASADELRAPAFGRSVGGHAAGSWRARCSGTRYIYVPLFADSSQRRHVSWKRRPIKRLCRPAFATQRLQFELCMAAPPPRPRRGAGRRFGVSAAALRLIKAACGARPRGAHVSQPPLFWRSRQPCCASPSLEPRLPLALPHPPPLSRPRTSACASAACDRRAAGAMAGLGALWDLILTALEEALFSVYLVVFRVTRGFIAVRLAVAARGAAGLSSLCGTPSCCFLSLQLQLC